MDNMVLYDIWIASQARNDGTRVSSLRGTKWRSNPEKTTKTIHWL